MTDFKCLNLNLLFSNSQIESDSNNCIVSDCLIVTNVTLIPMKTRMHMEVRTKVIRFLFVVRSN